MSVSLEGWVAGTSSVSREAWITMAECVDKFNALYSSQYPEPFKKTQLTEYLSTADDAERNRVMAIVTWQPPRGCWED